MIGVHGDPLLGRSGTGRVASPAASAESDADLYERLAPELNRFAVSLVGPSDAEDLLGTAVLKAMSAKAWPTVTNRRAYLYRVLLNESRSLERSRRRRLARERRVADRDDREPEVADPAIMRALRALTPRQRAVIHLSYWADLPSPAVADVLGTPLRTIERELRTAKTRLKELLS